jgi:cobalamin biosynthesis protein CobT
VGGEEEDEDDLDLDDLPPSTAGADPDDGEGEESAEADEGSGSSPFRLSGDEGGGVGDIDDANEENDESIGGGAGNAGAKSLFDYEDDAFDEADMSSQIAILISDEAVLAMDPSQYVVFTREMDRVEPIVVPGDIEPTWVPQMEDAVRAAVGRMKKDVERMMASQSHVIRTPGHRRGKLHSPSLYRVQQGDPRVFSVKQEHTSKDTAVSLLMDNSGSMRGQKMRLATLAGYALSSTLEAVKISHEVLGFTSGSFYDVPPVLREAMRLDMERSGIDYDRVEPIMIPIYKDFDERMNSEIKRRFAYMMYGQRGLAGNIDGESLQYAAERLIKRPEKRKVMLVFSDGQPAGSDKSGPHLSWVVKDLERQGIETIGIGIMDRSVKKFYPKNVVLNDAAELPNEVMTAIKKILA